MFRRYLVLYALVIGALTSWPAHTQGQRFASYSSDLASVRGERVRVIVQADDRGLSNLATRHRHGFRRRLATSVALEIDRNELDALKRDSSVLHISRDLPVAADMAITNTVTRADTVWKGTPGLLGLFGTAGYNGSGIGVAVLDSGIAAHSAMGSRVIARVNFVSSEPWGGGDPFGHGTHVAGMIGGSGSSALYVTQAYNGGSAPAVRFIDVRVLGQTGIGYTSEVIAGIDWVIANRAKYGIRIINLSLGRPVAESAETDPLCQAVSRAVRAGIVVVASGGNSGMTATGARVLGGVSSPGNSPDAITVGALDTMGTANRSDDRVADFSSRGPTRYDFTVKPDVVAPGTRIVSTESAGSYIATRYPSWHVAGSGRNSYGRLSGTSMSTAVVTGGIALMLDAEPNLSPAQVKLIIQTGARFIPAEGLIGGGTGSVDFAQSLRIANAGLLQNVLTALTNVLGLSSGASFVDRGTLIDRLYDRTGLRLLSLLDLDRLLGGANSAEPGVLTLLGESNALGRTAPNHLVWGDYARWTSAYYIAWGTPMSEPTSGQHLVWGDMADGDHLVWGTSVVGENDRK
jgi:serine protease AprX